MKETLIMKVKPETLGNLMNALVDITSEMKDVEPDIKIRFMDEVYTSCLYLENVVLGSIRMLDLKKQQGK